MGHTREERPEHLAARRCWAVARRDDGAWREAFLPCLQALGVMRLREEAHGAARQRARGPGNEESAAKQRSGKTRQRNRTLRTGLTQLAHAAARTKDTYLSALYQRLTSRRARNRPSWPWPMRSSSVPFICYPATNRIRGWRPTTLMNIGVNISWTS
jgi:hypothetical protein